MKKRMILLVGCLVFSSIIWNLIIGSTIYKIPYVEQQSEIGKHYKPYSSITFGKEGFSKLFTDRNGFNNNDSVIDKNNIVLVVGDSHTEALQVPRGLNYTTVAQNNLPNYLNYNIYNIGVGGNSIAEYIYYGENYKTKFDPSKVIIQVTYNDFTSDALDESKDTYISYQEGIYRVLKRKNGTSKLRDIKAKFVAFSPFSALLYDKIKSLLKELSHPTTQPFFPKENQVVIAQSQKDYSELIEWEVKQISEIFKEKVAFLYFPQTPKIGDNNLIHYDPDEEIIKSKILEDCNKYGVDFIDMKSDFEYLINKEQKLPRGFNNSTIGEGHLNEYGHNITGRRLAIYLQGVK